MNVVAVFDLTGLATQAEYGLSSIFYYLFAAIFFLAPISFVAAELAASLPQAGGVFRWVGEAFGPRWGFVAIFLQWTICTIFFPSSLTFAWVAIAYINPNLSLDQAISANRTYTIIAILFIFWSAVYATLRGLKTSTRTTITCGLIGTIVPAGILILLGFLYLTQGNSLQIRMQWHDVLPQFTNISGLVLATAVFLDYAGIEMSAIHIRNMVNPQRNYPIALLLSACFIVGAFILTTLPISFLIPQSKIDLTQSLIITFDKLFLFYGMSWAGPVLAIALVLGIIGQLTVWLSGPSAALATIGKAGFLPPLFHRTNAYGVPSNILLLQGILVSLLVVTFTILPSVQAVFQILTQMAGSVYLLIYILMFSSCIYLRYTQPLLPRPYRIPGGKIGLWICAGVGLASALLGLALSFVPPSQISVGSPIVYSAILLLGIGIFVGMPLMIYAFRKPHWQVPGWTDDLQPFTKVVRYRSAK
jgi:putative glutamate/gamma-aminobutyrate antiporter